MAVQLLRESTELLDTDSCWRFLNCHASVMSVVFLMLLLEPSKMPLWNTWSVFISILLQKGWILFITRQAMMNGMKHRFYPHYQNVPLEVSSIKDSIKFEKKWLNCRKLTTGLSSRTFRQTWKWSVPTLDLSLRIKIIMNLFPRMFNLFQLWATQICKSQFTKWDKKKIKKMCG